MTDHDPLCPIYRGAGIDPCHCGLIAKVRADERERIAAAMNEAIAGARRMAIADERERIASLLEDYGYGDAAQIARKGGQ